MDKSSQPRIQGSRQPGRPLGPSIVSYLQERYGSLDNVRNHLPGLRCYLSMYGHEITPSVVDIYIESEGGPHVPVTVKDRREYKAPTPSRARYDAPSHRPVVYYIVFGGFVKIGTTTNLKRRLTALPHDEVLATEPGSYHLEAERHTQFRSLRHKGEWFRYEGALRDHIEELRQAE